MSDNNGNPNEEDFNFSPRKKSPNELAEMIGERLSHNKIVVVLPPEVVPYQRDIQRFVDAMVYKLKVHSKKGKWEKYSTGDAMRLLRKEVEELDAALMQGNLIEVLMEAGDVGNFALIVASIVTERGQ